MGDQKEPPREHAEMTRERRKEEYFHKMSFENWNRFVQEQLSLNKERTKEELRKNPAAAEEINPEIQAEEEQTKRPATIK